MNRLYIGDVEINLKSSTFPGGEVYVKIDQQEDNRFRRFRIESHIRHSSDVMELLMLTDAVRRKFGSDIDIDLVMPYLPYARQDRVCRAGESLSIAVFCNLINSQGYSDVEVWDCHSEVGLALLDNLTHRKQWQFVRNIDLPKNTCLVSPDLGATKKLEGFSPAVVASKFRDEDEVHLEIIKTSLSDGDENLLVVDDICDGGATFIALAKELRKLTDGNLYLYTTHGIYSKGIRPLMKYYKHFYTANPFAEVVNSDIVTIVKY